MTSTQIELRDVTRTYGEGEALVKALDAVDLDIVSGEFLALAGPSGSGKTTLLNVIGSIDAPTGGRIVFEGTDLGSLSNRERTHFRNLRIGFIFQDFNLIPVLSAREKRRVAAAVAGRQEPRRAA